MRATPSPRRSRYSTRERRAHEQSRAHQRGDAPARARPCSRDVPAALGHYFLNTGFGAVEIWHSTEAFADALIEMQQRYGFDGILVNLPGRDPDWRRHVRLIEDDGGSDVVRWIDGSYTVCP